MESLLMEESVRQKMTAHLALVGGTNSDNLMRWMLAAAMTSALASRLNWAGKKDMRCSESKKPFKDTTLQHSMFVAAVQQFNPKLTDKDYSKTVKKWLCYAPEREGGIPRNQTQVKRTRVKLRLPQQTLFPWFIQYKA
ncbi:hypothetical protein ATANTOWER_026030 [Ataeniobius toweri]|uniref:DUF4806 domain-containing protein n=1 Tax=Ataeniobius toweri TaxID=208326 RepID=A0ABU7ATG1_9TELE|nr:hypothetical protein [Ataeniobius toweri]